MIGGREKKMVERERESGQKTKGLENKSIGREGESGKKRRGRAQNVRIGENEDM